MVYQHGPQIWIRWNNRMLTCYRAHPTQKHPYLYPLIAHVTGQTFFVQTAHPQSVDFVYFSYVTLTTVGYGDFTASTSAGRMFAVSEALTGQLYLVSAVALLVGNIGRTIVRGSPATGVEMTTVGWVVS